VSTWSVVFLGVIALSTLMMAVIQVGAIIYSARLARRLETLLGRLESDIKPLLERVTTISTEAARMSTLATAQVERVDQLFADLQERTEHVMTVVQQAIITPAREGAALFSALRSTFAAFRGMGARANGRGSQQRPPRGVEEDDALFIG
jgi:ABC-type transporter Mla subunit MlaD